MKMDELNEQEMNQVSGGASFAVSSVLYVSLFSLAIPSVLYQGKSV